jgi:membrane-bound metal-dependent hydrolase YbcI (DUF457 family)
MYSAILKLWRAFMHSLAMLIALFLLVALLATVLQTPVEIAKALGYKWASKIVRYFQGE